MPGYGADTCDDMGAILSADIAAAKGCAQPVPERQQGLGFTAQPPYLRQPAFLFFLAGPELLPDPSWPALPPAHIAAAAAAYPATPISRSCCMPSRLNKLQLVLL